MATFRSLLTPRLLLRGWRPEDVDDLSQAVLRDVAHLRPWLPWAEREPISREVRLEWIEQVGVALAAGVELYLGIWSREDGRLLGGHGLHRTEAGGPFETGYWVASTELRKGVAREATAAVTRYALGARGLHELLIRIRPGNTASARVAESLGFTGPFRQTTSPIDRCGARQPVLVYTMSRSACERAPFRDLPVSWVDAAGRQQPL